MKAKPTIASAGLPESIESGQRNSDSLFRRWTHKLLFPKEYRWWHGATFWLAVNAVSAASYSGDNTLYQTFKQAPFAPPAWAFGPAWTLNNISVLWGNLRLLNLPDGTPGRGTLLGLQGVSWTIFGTFSLVYFRLASPILAFVWTAGMYALTIASMILASKIDRKIVLSFATLFVWLSLATLVGAYQMIYNADPFIGTPAWR